MSSLVSLPGVLALAALAGWAADRFALPAGWMLGAIVAGLGLALTRERAPAVPAALQRIALAAIGVRLASTVDPGIWPLLGTVAPALLIFTAGLLAASVGAGLLLARVAGVPRATGVLAFVPGGASAMVAMSGDVGADPRFVATVQYVRLVVVVLSAPLLAALAVWAGGGAEMAAIPGVSRPMIAAGVAGGSSVSGALVPHAVTYGALIGGLVLNRRLPIPAGGILLPLVLLLGATLAGWPHAPLPAFLGQGAFVVLGLWVGLQFDRPSLRRAGIAAVWAAGLTLALVGIALVLGFGIHLETGMALETALLGTTPGAIDTMTAIALDLSREPALVLAMQLFRMLAAVVVGPAVVRALAGP
nr:AbrB family transcriptional regulator [Limnochorda pilosa]